MRNFLRYYSLKEHIGIVAAIYSLIGLFGNLLLFTRQLNKAKKETEKKKGSWLESVGKREVAKAVAVNYVKRPTKGVKAFNGIVGVCFLLDLCAYPLIKKAADEL